MEKTADWNNKNGIGVQQVPVEDEIEPGHVPIAEILKANQFEM